MGQVTIYLDDELEELMTAEAKAHNLSKSRWLANMIREKLNNTWPKSVIDAAGSWDDFPELTTLRHSLDADLKREAF